MTTAPPVAKTLPELHRAVEGWRGAGERVALVPTMGALHAGHLSLLDAARAGASRAVVSIFVNPAQFAPTEDLDAYPRTWEADLALLAARGADLVYAPDAAAMYPAGFGTGVAVEGPAVAGLEDRFRPHFFRGVATVVCKLLNRCRCDAAVFGEKDFQQLLVVRRMVADLDIPVEIVGVPTVRDHDGLALSSRNRNLSRPERARAAALPRVLGAVAAGLRAGGDAAALLSRGIADLERGGLSVDYLEARDAETLGAPRRGGATRVLAAARLAATRLIDNMAA